MGGRNGHCVPIPQGNHNALLNYGLILEGWAPLPTDLVIEKTFYVLS